MAPKLGTGKLEGAGSWIPLGMNGLGSGIFINGRLGGCCGGGDVCGGEGDCGGGLGKCVGTPGKCVGTLGKSSTE